MLRNIGRSDHFGDLLLGKTFKFVPAFNLLSKIPPELVIKETAYRIIVNGKFLLLNADFIVILAVRIVKPAFIASGCTFYAPIRAISPFGSISTFQLFRSVRMYFAMPGAVVREKSSP